MRRYPADRLAVIAGAARAVVIVCPGEADPASDGLALILGAFVVLVFAISIAKIQAGMPH